MRRKLTAKPATRVLTSLLGANMIKDYPNLARLAQPEPEAPAEEASDMPEARIWLTWQRVDDQ